MQHLYIDIETYSGIDLAKSGLYRYVQSPDFSILMIAYSWDGEEPHIIDLSNEDSDTHLQAVALAKALNDPNVIKHAYNAAFEWYCLNTLYPSPIDQWRCTMVHAMYCGYPAGLAATGQALGLPQGKQKMSAGKALIRTFCNPAKSNGEKTRILPNHEPEKWELFKEYCRQDVIAEMEIEHQLEAFPLPDEEQKLWEIDQSINARGVAIDRELLRGALAVNAEISQELTSKAVELTGLDNPNSAAQLMRWLRDKGVETENLQKATVAKLKDEATDPVVKEALGLRLEMAKSSVSKYTAMNGALCNDGRIRGLIQFYGANRTGRWAGRLVQVHNLPRNYLNTLDLARQLTKRGDLATLKIIYGNVPDTLSQLIRTAFIPAPGNIFIVADFSAIEARVIAWLAKERWRQDVFATHGRIYEASASAMFGVPIDKIKKGNPEYALRQKGKIAELALGYGGSAGALVQMGALNMGLDESELPEIVHRWRHSNPRIVDLWYSLENAAVHTLSTGQACGCNGILFNREYNAESEQAYLTVRLPSGRKLYYVSPFLAPNRWGKPSIHYYGVGVNNKWSELETYGGKLTENIVQAIARDCLAHAIKLLENAGYKIVMHVHDEVIIETPRPDDPKEELAKACNIMCLAPSWAEGLQLNADGFTAEYYKKE